jgi:WD40 repeat protein
VDALAFSANGKAAATGSKDGSIRIWDLEKRQLLPGGDWFVFDKGVAVADIALTPDGKTLIATSDLGDVRVCTVANREVVHRLKAHAHRILACQVSYDGKRFVTVGADNVIKLWDLATAKELRAWDTSTPVADRPNLSFIRSIIFSPDGKQLVAGNENSTLFVLDLP